MLGSEPGGLHRNDAHAFNSLFEMLEKKVCLTALIGLLSILYLRCSPPYLPLHAAQASFNSLFEMPKTCPRKGAGPAGGLFQFSI